jgi:hypothetical protein
MPSKGNKCCCDEAVPCALCSGGIAAAQWEVTLSGITAGSCSAYCANFNRTWTLSFVASSAGTCVWRETLGRASDCFGASNIVQLQVSTGAVHLFLGPSSIFGAEYSKGSAIGDCNAPQILTRVVNPATCGNWPATVTVTPL